MKKFFRLSLIMALFSISAYAFENNTVWLNENHNAQGVKKIVVTNNGFIEVFSSNKNGRQAWGRTTYTRTANGLLATWKGHRSGYKVVVLEKIQNHKMRATIKYLRGNGRDNKVNIVNLRKYMNPNKKYVGRWINQDRGARGITQLNISSLNRELLVEAWKSCSTGECSLGKQRARVSNNQIVLRLDRGNKVLTIRETRANRGVSTLEVVVSRNSHNGMMKSQTFYLTKSRRR